jgi:hypothetical protein
VPTEANREKERSIAALRERSRTLERKSQDDALTGISKSDRLALRIGNVSDSCGGGPGRTVVAGRRIDAAWIAVIMLLGGNVPAADTGERGAGTRLSSVVPFTRNNRCMEHPYRQLAVSLPLSGTSDGGEGHPWRAMYGFCVAEKGRFTLHQDWVVSYLDAEPQRDSPGGAGVSLGTDFALQWRHRQTVSFTPYYELGGGIQYAAGTPFPAHGSRWMFTINTGAGLIFPLKPNLQMRTALRYLHISNAGIFPGNAGYDAFHLVVALKWSP